VTKDIPAGVVAVGNPCKVLRKITEQDKMSYSMMPGSKG
jgi:maltose O-acetyltransferase